MPNLMPRPGSPLPDIRQWFEGEWPFGERHPVRVESYLEGNEYVIHCELPGMDPERDIHVTAEGDQLRIEAERSEEDHTDRHTEFRYGSFSRVITLPTGCQTDQINASYDAGILTIRMPKRESEAREIPVSRRPGS